MADQVFNVTIKGIGDFSDVVSNVNSVQKALTKLKLPDKLGDNLNKKISAFGSEYEKYQKKISEGIKTQGDYNQVEKSLNRMRTLYQEIGQDVSKISKLDMDSILNLDLGEFKQLRNEIANIEKEINKIQIGKINPKAIEDPMKALRSSLKSKKFSEKDTGLLDQLIGNVKSGKVQEAKAVLNELDNAVKKITPPKNADGSFMERVVGKLNPGNAKAATGAIEQLKQVLSSTDEEVKPLITVLDQLQKEFAETQSNAKGEILGGANKFKETENSVERVTDSLKKMHQEEFGFNRQVQDIDRQIQSYFGLSQMIRKVGDIARDAFNTVKELDQAMTETAVVTNFSVGDMWNMLPTYTEQANKLGATIKDVYEAATLYYQQGLNTNQAMGLANETLKMARIAGMDAAEATDMMTSALRGFNMEINQASAQKVNDIYSQLAAVTASDTRELGTAMEKTASLASSANMDIETTSAFLAQMIETTREAPENLGTAMKTIIARFQEMKKDPTQLIDSEGQAMDVNKIDTALKSIGVALTNTKGEFRDLDDVFLDISEKWDSLSQGQQRYIATTAAGSRQQSRFIAMMSNYDRTMELVNEANNSAGASQKQFEKTMDSMSSKLNQLKNAWDEFTMGLMNNQILKAGVTGLTQFFTIVNRIIDALGKISPKPLEGLTKSALTLAATLGGLNFAKNFARGSIMAGAGWWKGEGSIKNNFIDGFNTTKHNQPQFNQNDILRQQIASKLSSETIKSMGIVVNAPVSVNAYLERINTSNLSDEVKAKINAELQGKTSIDSATQVKVNTILDNSQKESGIGNDFKISNNMVNTIDKFNELTQKTGQFTNGMTQMGVTLQEVGAKMGPFGGILRTIGSVMTSLGTTLNSLTTAFSLNFATAAKNIPITIAGTQTTLAQIIADEGLTKANIKLAMSSGAVGKAILSTVSPFLAIAAAIAAVIVIYKQLDKAIVTDKERLEEASNAAAKASDAYSTAKQDLSGLNDSIEQIQTNEDAFQGLVAGTAEFNAKLVEANQTITELINKFPELNDPKYLSTDKNGLMHLNKSGLDLVKNRQTQIVGNAAALNSLQAAQLKSEENRQKAEQLLLKSQKEVLSGKSVDTNKSIYDPNTGAIMAKEEDQKRAALLRQEADAAERMAKQQAIYNSLTSAEIGNREKIAAIYESTYDTALEEAKLSKASIDDQRQAYADFYGYTYNKSRKKITDEKGVEIEGITDEVIKDAFPEITVLANIEANGESLDNMMNTIDRKFAKEFGSSSKSILTDVLSNNIETDENALQQLIQNPEGLKEAVQELSSKEIAALLNISEDLITDKTFDTYADQLTTNIEERASKIIEAQVQTYNELGAMMAQAQYEDTEFVERNGESAVKPIADLIQKLSAEQRTTLNTIGKSLQENVGSQAMSTFLKEASSIYLSNNESLTKEFDNVIRDISWDSPISRLEGYNKAIRSTRGEIRQFGEDMRSSVNEANLLGESFDEFLGGDWLDLSENADEFKNAIGEIDGAGILKASESSRQLKVLLDSGEVSASGLAVALQGVEDGSILQVNDSVLQLVSSLNRAKDVALEAHNIVQNFDPGVDYGEGEDFMVENAKKVKEYMDNNEWGNEQLQNYIKMAAGQDRWNDTLKDYKGDLEATTEALQHYATDFAEGTANVWDKFTKRIGADGDTFNKNLKNIKDENLRGRFRNVTFDWGKDDTLEIELGDLNTKEFEEYLQKVGGLSEDYAKLMIQNLVNYDGTFGAKLRANDIKSTIQQDKEFQRSRTDQNGNLVLTSQDIGIIESSENGEQILKTIADDLNTSVSELKNNALQLTKKNGEERSAKSSKENSLMNEYSQKFFGKNLKEMIKGDNPFTTAEGKFNLESFMADLRSKDFSDQQTLEGAYRAYKDAGEKSTIFNGVELEKGLNLEEFADKMNEITESDQWVTVGETIGQQIVSAMEASALLDRATNGQLEEKAFDNTGKTTQTFDDVINAIKISGEDKGKQQEDVAKYLEDSKKQFESLDTKQQAEALQSVVSKLNELKFGPEEISYAINKGLGISFDANSEGRGALSTNEKGQVTLDSEEALTALQEQLGQLEGTITTVNAPKEIIDQAFGNVTAHVTGIISAISTDIKDHLATGQNNPNSAFHRVGTMARGSRSGYTISGRPTLTGEEGEELVWEPKQNKAYMVGLKGPQFANISKDAVVWNADQTKRIKKNSGSVGQIGTGARGIIPFGTMAGGTGGLKIPGTGTLDLIGNVVEFKIPESTNKDQGPMIDITAGVSALEVKGEAKTIKDIKGEVTADKVDKKGQITGEPVKLSGIVENVTVTKEKQEKKEQPQKTVTTTTNVKTTSDGKAQKEINSIKHSGAVKIKTQATPDAQNTINKIKGKSVDIHINPKFDGSWEKTATVKVHTEKAAHGKNNHIQYHSAPSFGSAAKGRYGTVGPKDKGGLTLTGERGYEIAWLPSENRSMILGVGGPQMITLPEDAVVYTHEQSKDIIKRKGIPAGSQDKGKTGIKRPGSSDGSSNGSNSNSGGTNRTNNDKKKKDPKKDDKKDNKKEKANTSAISKIIVWWDNITRRADATQRKADKNQKTYEKYLKDIRATLKDTGTIGGGNDFISNTNKAINLYNDQLKQAAFELRNLTIGTEGQRNAAKTKTKKDDKKANKRAFLNEAGGAVKISYSKKSGKKKKTVNQIIDTAKYIKEQDGTYIIDQSQLNKIKNSEKRKALADALNKEINDRISKKNAAEDNIEKANEALEKFSEELYNTFFAWENELTKIWNITQKIEQAQSRMSMNDAYDELLKAQLSTGKLTAGAESRNKDLTNFRSRLESQNDLLKERQEAITESQNNLRRILNSEDEKQTLTKVNDKLNATQKLNELNNAKQAKQAYDNAITSRKTTQDNISKIQAKITKLKDKKNLSKADKQEIEKLRKQRDNLKKQKENYDKIIKDNKALAGKVNQLQQEYNNVSSNALNETQKRGYEQYQKELTDQITAQDMARKYTDVTKRANGTIDVHFNTEAFENERLNGNITNDMAKAVQDWVKKLQEATTNLQQNYEDLTKEVTEYYTQLDTLQQEWADYGKELTEITETYEKEKIDKIKQLSDEIKKTLDKLLNDVKRNLDERRRQQENTKTEQDISQKQQRLAALRADTSGGHQVEIAQLEKEIAEAQQNYQNSLEDQLLDKLQQQADLAAEQRERQIELQEMLVNSVSNIEKVNEWMIQAQGYSKLSENEQNAFKEEVRAGYRSKNNYDQLTKAERDEVDTNFEEFFHGLVTNSEKQKELNSAISGLEGTLKTLDSYLEKQNQLAASSSSTGGGGNAGVGSTGGGSTSVGNTSGGNKTTTAATKEEARVAALRNYDKKLNDYASNGKLSGSELKKLIEAGSNSYVNKNGAAVFADLHRVGFSWDKILAAAKAAKYSKKDIKTWGSSDAFKKALKSYSTGGLANFTGPAWLDGTPSKPELVLNSTDTRNFIALRDVLGKVMSSNGSTENSYTNTEFNININVEKVANDYDVDRIITKVKKEITKSAGYRNVTQVRSLR